MTMQRRGFLGAMAGGAAGLVHLGAFAQAEPIGVMRIINGFPAGTTPDVVARKVGDRLAGGLARSVIVENRTGAGGQIAASVVKSAPADGSSLLLTPMAVMGVYPHTYKKLPYDPVADFEPVSMAALFDYAIAVGPAVPETVKTLPQLMAWYKANPSKATIASSATGSPLHFVGVMAGRAMGVELTHVGYRGTPPAITDMLGGTMPAICAPLGTFLPLREAGKIRILASTGPKRSRFTPDVPTFVEEGLKDFVHTEWYSFFAPAKTPAATIARLNADIGRALQAKDVVDSFASFGMEAAPSSPADLAASLRSKLQTWGPIVKSIGFVAD
jgi:tripartite-type tricarboxylate transporter receptor subunit TctC